MKLIGGEIYFIRERDLQKDALSEYVKVGIVREDAKSGARTSEERLKEHQTGNPRELVLSHVIQATMVEKVETIVHEYFALTGIRGEWLRIENDDLSPIYKKAQEFADAALEAAPFFAAAEEFSSQLSTEAKIPATDEAVKLLKVHNVAHHSLKHYENLKNEISQHFKVAIAKNEPGVTKAAKIQFKKSKQVFDKALLKEKYPELYALFLETKTQEPSGKFLPAITRKPEDEVAEFLVNQTKAISEAISKVVNHGAPTITLHKPRLELNWLIAKATWDKEVAKSKLQVMCGTNSGIDNICTWIREEKKIEKFNEASFQEAHPKEYEECTVEKEGGQALIVDKKIGYSNE